MGKAVVRDLSRKMDEFYCSSCLDTLYYYDCWVYRVSLKQLLDTQLGLITEPLNIGSLHSTPQSLDSFCCFLGLSQNSQALPCHFLTSSPWPQLYSLSRALEKSTANKIWNICLINSRPTNHWIKSENNSYKKKAQMNTECNSNSIKQMYSK